MKNTFLLLVFISIILNNNKVSAQCVQAESYVAKIQNAQDNWSPTKYASSGKQISAWTQFATWNTYKCQCDSPDNLSDSEIPQLVNAMNATRGIISKEYSTYGTVPRVYKVSDCKKGNFNSTNSASSKTSTQIEIENRFRNYNNAMSLKRQGENIAKAYAQQVKSYGELNQTNSPEALLQNFYNNMQAIADLQTKNKADNLNQLTNTLNSSLNDLNSGNYEGAMFSVLSLIDQGEAKREARRQAEAVKQQLIIEAATQMNNFYWKAIELNDNAIDQYFQRAAYAYTKEEEAYLLKYVEYHKCFKESMTTNFSFSSTSWTKNNCTAPTNVVSMSNNLIAKDIQYIQTAKRKYKLYLETGRTVFQQGAMKFAGLAASTKPKAEYYYLMGHFAGKNNPLVAYSSFLTVQSKSSSYFEGDKYSEFLMIKLCLEKEFKKAIKENNKEVIKKIVGAGIHNIVNIDEDSPIIYAISIDQPDVVQAFLNTDLEGKTQSVITKKVRDVIMAAAMLDAPNIIKRFSEMGFGLDFTAYNKSPIDIAIESKSIKSTYYLLGISERKQEYLTRLINQKSDIIKLDKIVNQHSLNLYKELQSVDSKTKAIRYLYFQNDKLNFFKLLKNNKDAIELAKSVISIEQFRRDFYIPALFRIEEKLDEDKDRLKLNLIPFSDYIKYNLIGLNNFMIKGWHLQQIKNLLDEEAYGYSLYELEKQTKVKKSGEELYHSYVVTEAEINTFRKREKFIRKNDIISDKMILDMCDNDNIELWKSYKNSFPESYEELINDFRKNFLINFRNKEKHIRNTSALSDDDIRSFYKAEMYDAYNSLYFISDETGLNLLSSSVNKANSTRNSSSFEVREHVKIAISLLRNFYIPKDATYKLNFYNIVERYSTKPEKIDFVNLAIEKKIKFNDTEFYKLIDEIRNIDNLDHYNLVKNNIDLVIKNNLTDLSKDIKMWRDYSFFKRKSKEVQNAYKRDKKYWKAVFEGNYNKRY